MFRSNWALGTGRFIYSWHVYFIYSNIFYINLECFSAQFRYYVPRIHLEPLPRGPCRYCCLHVDSQWAAVRFSCLWAFIENRPYNHYPSLTYYYYYPNLFIITIIVILFFYFLFLFFHGCILGPPSCWALGTCLVCLFINTSLCPGSTALSWDTEPVETKNNCAVLSWTLVRTNYMLKSVEVV